MLHNRYLVTDATYVYRGAILTAAITLILCIPIKLGFMLLVNPQRMCEGYSSHSVADLGISEGDSAISLHTKRTMINLRPRPLSVKPHRFLIILERDFLLYLSINPFSIKFYSKAC